MGQCCGDNLGRVEDRFLPVSFPHERTTTGAGRPWVRSLGRERLASAKTNPVVPIANGLSSGLIWGCDTKTRFFCLALTKTNKIARARSRL